MGPGDDPGNRVHGRVGPDEQGRYLVRQFGVIATGTGQFAVALAAAPASGSFTEGTAILTRLAQWVGERAQKFPTVAGCP